MPTPFNNEQHHAKMIEFLKTFVKYANQYIAESKNRPAHQKSRRPKIHTIQTIVCQEFGVPMEYMTTGGRKEYEVKPRSVAIALCYKLTDHTHAELGIEFGGRHHTTIEYAISRVKGWCEEKDFAEAIDRVESICRARLDLTDLPLLGKA